MLLFSGEHAATYTDERGDDEKQLEKYSKWLSTFITGKLFLFLLYFIQFKAVAISNTIGAVSLWKLLGAV